MRENVFQNAVHLMNLKRNHSETQLREKVEMAAMNITWSKRPLRNTFLLLLLRSDDIKRLDTRVVSLRE